jgi:hypothetical protein
MQMHLHAGFALGLLLDVRVVQQANCYPMIPAGRGRHAMMLSDTKWYSDAV